MLRSQILLTEEIDKEVKKLASQQGISNSGAVRKLLTQALNVQAKNNNKAVGDDLNQDKYLYSLDEFTEKNSRIDGFKELYSVGAKVSEIVVIGDRTFRFYLKNKKLPKDFKDEVTTLSESIKRLSLTNKLVVRRAYVVPGLDNPPGPRFIGLDVREMLGAIKEIFDFAIEHDYHKSKKSRICAFFYPFADPKPIKPPVKDNVQIPYGGYAFPLNKNGSRIEVFAVWGNNEGVQSFDSVDRYVVDTKRMIIVDKSIPQKSVMLATTINSQSEKIRVPLSGQFKQVLGDNEILETARIVSELKKKYGLRRVEFSYDGKQEVEYNESAPYKIIENIKENIDKKGKIYLIKEEKDVKLLKKTTKKQENFILYIDSSIIEKRSYDLLHRVAGLSKKFTVLYPGLSATAHVMRVLSDFGHTAITVGNRKFKHGEEVIIKTNANGQLSISKLEKSEIAKYVVNLYDAKLFDIQEVGGKAYNLSLLKTNGFSVPHGFVLTTEFFDHLLSQLVGADRYKKLISSPSTLSESIEQLRDSETKIPLKLWKKIVKGTDLDKQLKYAVRSSATVEDSSQHAFAGQFSSYLNVDYKDLATKVGEVINSTFSQRVVNYFQALGKPWSTKMAVVVQEQVEAQKSGVSFSKDVRTGNEDHMVIEVAKGLAEGIVDDKVKTYRIIYSKSKGQLVSKRFPKNLITETELNAVIEMTLRLEQLMDSPQDIEWSYDNEGNLWVIQSRDI